MLSCHACCPCPLKVIQEKCSCVFANCCHLRAAMQAEITRNVTETIQPVDQYPKGRQFLHDEDYLSVVRDMLNLSNILDDMEQTGWVPYTSRTQYYNMYSKLYRSLLQRASSNPR